MSNPNQIYQYTRRNLIWLLIIALTCHLSCSGQVTTNPFFKEPNFFSSKWEQEIFLKQEEEKVPLYFFTSFENSASSNNATIAMQAIKEEARYLARHRIKNNRRYLRKIFEHVHLVFLKKYSTYSNFNRIFDVHHFDCVTGTALFAALFDEMGIGYDIYETANHSYLIVRLGQEQALFESTDPLNGFILDPDSIAKTQAKYAHEIATDFNNLLGMVGYKNAPINNLKVYSERIDLRKLAGLYYYNQAVIFYNIKEFKKSVNALEKAFTLYPSKRIMNLLLISIQEVLRLQNLSRDELKRHIAKTNYYAYRGQEFFN